MMGLLKVLLVDLLKPLSLAVLLLLLLSCRPAPAPKPAPRSIIGPEEPP